MAKRSRRGLTKKGLSGLIRITNDKKMRVWRIFDKEYPTLREVVLTYRLMQLKLLQKSTS